MKKTIKKLRLDREHIRLLSSSQLGDAAGGKPNLSGATCECPASLDGCDTADCPHPPLTFTCRC